MKNIIVLVTSKDKIQAKKIAAAILKDRLAACVNILPAMESLFVWEGKIDKAREHLLIIKTTDSMFVKLEKTIKSLHSYQVPEIIAIPIIKGHQPYMDWIRKSAHA